MNLSDCPFSVAAATDAEADRGSAAERAEDPKKRRRPNRLAVSPQNRVISTADGQKRDNSEFLSAERIGSCFRVVMSV